MSNLALELNLISRKEALSLLGRSPKTSLEWLRDHNVPAYKPFNRKHVY